MPASETRTSSPSSESADRKGTPSREARLVLLLEADRPLASSARFSLTGIRRVRIGRGPDRCVERADGVLTVRVPDRWMSSEHAELICVMGHWHVIDVRSRNGCFVNGERVMRHPLCHGDLIELGHALFLVQGELEVEPSQSLDMDAGSDALPPPGLFTFHPGLARELTRVAQLASTPVSFLITGESGTGKEVLARAIHGLSGRAGDFVGVNCGAIPDSLIESELFGHKKGAFSGAVADRPGLVRSAHRGTLFLDEIGDLPAAAQAVFLRVLQEREVRPVGETRAAPVDIRLLSATHKDVTQQVESGRFRRDLYARIAGVRVRLPPLRERREDIGILIASLLPRVAAGCERPRFTIDAARALFTYSWPMNIRELETCLLTAAVLAGDRPIGHEHLPEELRLSAPAAGMAGELSGEHAALDRPGQASSPAAGSDDSASGDRPAKPARKKPSAEIDQSEIVATLASYQGNIARTARALGLSRQALYRRIERFGISLPRARSEDQS